MVGYLLLYMGLGAVVAVNFLLICSLMNDYKNMKKCPKCGKRNWQFARYCGRCRSELGGKA